MRASYRFLLSFLALFSPGSLRAQEVEPVSTAGAPSFDTEHIFGFAEGSDIGGKGEREIESFTVGSFGAPGHYSNFGNETTVHYNFTDELRASVGGLTDYFNIYNAPGVSGRHQMDFSGLMTEVRWNILNRQSWPFGMTLTVDPQWRRTDPVSGEPSVSFAIPAALLLDKELIAGRLFAAVNLIYSPEFLRARTGWLHQDSFTIIFAGSYALSPDILVGGEILHENLGVSSWLDGHALFAGPQLFVRISDGFTVTVAWLAQLPDIGAGHLDLESFDRHQAGVKLAYTF
jgi:hypothetical protein